MKEYKKQQIIKHALEFYILNKKYNSEVERIQDENVLLETQLDIMTMKDEYGIKLSDKEEKLAEKYWIK